ncbi:MAG: DNA-binding protein [Firmicutes bacterium]|nr:DNA-binding protein [Bacillota bacterium]
MEKQIDWDSLPPFFGVKTLKKLLDIGENNAYALTRRPGFPCLRISSRTIRISRDGLKAWLPENYQREG